MAGLSVGGWKILQEKQFNFSEVIAWLATPCVIINRHYYNRGKHMSKQLKGSLMVITAGIAWGISGVSCQSFDEFTFDSSWDLTNGFGLF